MSYGPPPTGGGTTPYGGPATPVGPPRRSPLALGALVAGVLGLLLTVLVGSVLGPVLGLGAIATGFVARRQITASAGTLSGRGMALSAIIVGAVPVLLLVVSIILIATGVVDTSQSSTN